MPEEPERSGGCERAAGAVLLVAEGNLGLPKEDAPKGFELGAGPGGAAVAGAGSGKVASKVWSSDAADAWLGFVSREC